MLQYSTSIQNPAGSIELMRVYINHLEQPHEALRVGCTLLDSWADDDHDHDMMKSSVLMMVGMAELILSNTLSAQDVRMEQEQKAAATLRR